MRRAFVVTLLLVPAACSGPLATAEGQFKDGRYPDAEQTLSSLEAGSKAWSSGQRATYALYRGLALGALGDRERSLAWLHDARSMDRAEPGLLSDDDARRLKVALDADEGP